MKFTQFLELEKLSEEKNTPVKEIIESVALPGPLNPLHEAGDKEDNLDTKKGNIVTKKGRMRMVLNKQAKKMQDGLNKDLGEKFIKPYYYLYCLFVFLGSIWGLDLVWHFVDAVITFMTIPNLIAILLLTPVVVKETKDYFKEMENLKLLK